MICLAKLPDTVHAVSLSAKEGEDWQGLVSHCAELDSWPGKSEEMQMVCACEKGCEAEKCYVQKNGLWFEKTDSGLVFAPVFVSSHRKHDCPDCMECACCSDSRCLVCRNTSDS